jgi:branched-chain amino acid transport system ATP-binding protein
VSRDRQIADVMNGSVSEAAVLSMEDVGAGYQNLEVLKGVQLCVRPATVVALLGPNGAGKTTLLRYASGLLRGHSGRLRVNGRDMTGCSATEVAKAGVCHIPEGRSIYPSLTVRENISLFSPQMKPDDLVGVAIAAFPTLRGKLNRVAGTLSGGEQQMLALSRAYTGLPSVVLLDEVSMGLAPIVVGEIFNSIETLKQNRIALLLVEQYVDRALALADYVYVLNRGQVQAAGPADEFSRDRVRSSYLGRDT